MTLPIHPILVGMGPGILLSATGLVFLFVLAATGRASTAPVRLIVAGMGLMLLGAAVLALVGAVAQRSLIGLLAVLALAGPGLTLMRLALKAREHETNATGVRTVVLDFGAVWRHIGAWQVIVSGCLIVAIVAIAVTSGQLVFGLLAIAPTVTLLTGAAVASIQQPDTAHRVNDKR